MKQLIMITALIVCCQLLFSQQSEIEIKLKGIQVKAIQGGKLVDYDLVNQIKNKVVILEFWETWCGPCIAGMPHLKELKDKFPNDLEIICISSDDIIKTKAFVSQNPNPFDYVYDETKQLSAVFPHSSIPHTVVINKKGEVKAETNPGFLTEETIKQLISGNPIDAPTIKLFAPENLKSEKSEQSLLLFDLKSTTLEDKNYSSSSTRNFKKRIYTGYIATAYKDTIETIHEVTLAGKNILDLYRVAFNDINEERFIYPKRLDYINSTSPANRYRLNYSVSNLLGDFNTILVRQLNAVFGLEASSVLIDTTVLFIKKVEPNGRSITIESNPNRGKSSSTNMDNQHFEANGTCLSVRDLAGFVETKTHMQVEWDESDTRKFNVDVSIESDDRALENWLRLFEKEGLFLVKEKKKVEYIRIY